MNNKGFIFILVAIGIFISSLLFIPTNNYEAQDFSQEIIKMKTKISNYEIIIQKVAIDCNWEKDIINCIDSNSDELINILEINKEINCSTSNFLKLGNDINYLLNCKEEIKQTETLYSIDLNKEIKITKIN